MRKAYWLVLLVLIVSCKKEAAVDANIIIEGRWKYQRDSDSWMTLTIYEDSKGDIYYNGDGWPGEFATLSKTWYIKENELLFGKNPNKDGLFSIDTSPTVATNPIYTTFDTIIVGQKYMYLNGNLYIDQP